MTNRLKRRMLRWLIRWRMWLLACGLLLGLGGALVSRNLQMDRSLDNLFSAGDPVLEPYHQLQESFGQYHIVLVVFQEPHLNTPAGLAHVEEVAASFRQLPGIISAVSLLDVPGLVENDGQALKTDDRAERLKQLFAGYTHNIVLDAAGITCLLDKSPQAAASNRVTIRQMQDLTAQLPGGIMVGEPVLLGEAFDLLEEDGRRLNTWSLALLLLTIFLCYRRVRWLVMPLVLVQVALAMTRGILVLGKLELSMVSSMLAAIVTVVGVATVMHVIVRFRDYSAKGLPPAAALLQAGQLLAAPVVFACLTDAVGFGSLMVSEVQPVKDFGLMMAIGSLSVLLAIALTVPAIALWGKHREEPHQLGEGRLQRRLQQLYGWSRRNGVALGMFLFAVSNGAVIGSTWLLQETNFIRNFRADSSISRAYGFVDEHFGGAGVWDVLVPAPATLDKKYLTQVLALENRLRSEVPELSGVLSLADMLDAGTGGLDNLSFGANMAIRAGLSLMRGRMPHFVGSLYNPRAKADERYFRILLRSPENMGARQKTKLINDVERITRESFPEAQVTGFYTLLTHLIESLLRDQWTTFAAAAVGILLIMTWAFGSFKLAVVTLVPNVLPVLWLFGAMGLVGVPINMGAAMIAAVSLGLSVDGSIHYVIGYQRLRSQGHQLDDALRSVQSTVGRAAVLGTLALVVGFSTLAASEFVPTIYFGVLVSLSMIGGLVGNLIVLPLLIHWVDQKGANH